LIGHGPSGGLYKLLCGVCNFLRHGCHLYSTRNWLRLHLWLQPTRAKVKPWKKDARIDISIDWTLVSTVESHPKAYKMIMKSNITESGNKSNCQLRPEQFLLRLKMPHSLCTFPFCDISWVHYTKCQFSHHWKRFMA
jgi:hypothetical protein